MRTFLKGLKRVAESTPCPGFAGALPLPTSTLNAMVDRWLAQEALASLRNATTASLQFFGIRRSDEVFQSRKSDFKDLGEGGGFQWNIRCMKNARNGHSLTLPDYVGAQRPVGALLRCFLETVDDEFDDEDFIFRGTAKGDPARWSLVNQPLSAKAWDTALKSAITSVAPSTPPRATTSHALRKGGFTCAVESGIPMQIVNRIVGHVSSDMWQYYYIPSNDRVSLYMRRMR
jgi:integrase